MMLAFTPRWVLKQFNARTRQAEHTKGLIRQRLAQYDPVPPHPDLKLYGAEDNYEWKQYFCGITRSHYRNVRLQGGTKRSINDKK